MFQSALTDTKALSILINWNRFVKWDTPLSCSMTAAECCQVFAILDTCIQALDAPYARQYQTYILDIQKYID